MIIGEVTENFAKALNHHWELRRRGGAAPRRREGGSRWSMGVAAGPPGTECVLPGTGVSFFFSRFRFSSVYTGREIAQYVFIKKMYTPLVQLFRLN